MKLQQLRHFLAVVDFQTMHAASRMLGLSQPTLTRSIQALERSLNVTLLQRSAKRLVVTPTGERFYHHARVLLNDCAHAQDEAALRQAGLPSEVRIGIGGMFATYLIDTVLAEISSRFPHIRLKVTELLFEEMLEQLQAGLMDMVFSNLPRVRTKANIASEPLIALHHALFVRSDHALATKSRVTLVDVLPEHWLLIDQSHAIANFESGFVRADIAVPSRVLKTNSLRLMRSLMLDGHYICCMPEEFFEAELRQGLVKRLDVPQFSFQRRGGLVYRTDAYRSPSVNQVMNLIRAACDDAKTVEQQTLEFYAPPRQAIAVHF
jgi:DNA-binding transcriptional LysR family regulator